MDDKTRQTCQHASTGTMAYRLNKPLNLNLKLK